MLDEDDIMEDLKALNKLVSLPGEVCELSLNPQLPGPLSQHLEQCVSQTVAHFIFIAIRLP